jgi:hypothetical protein
MLPSVIDTQAVTSCPQKGAGGPIQDTCFAARAITALLPASPIPRPGDGTSSGPARSRQAQQTSLLVALHHQAAAASWPKRNALPSVHRRSSTVASFLASATLARFIPRRLATASAQRFKPENRTVLVSMMRAAS